MSLTPDGLIETWNPRADQLFGYEESAIVGQHFERLRPHQREAEFRDWFTRGMAGEVCRVEALAHDLRIMMRVLADRDESPSAVIIDARTLQSTPESGGRAGYDGAKKKNGSQVHAAVDTLGNLLAVTITAANEQERSQVAALAEQVQQATGGTVEIAYADQGDTAAAQAEQHSIE